MKICVASSWRNHLQPAIVVALRSCGHDVYDFRNPKPGDDGFRWSEVGAPGYKHGDKVSAETYRALLAHPRAAEGYESDISHVRDCDAVVYVLPCGRSASWEFGYAMGQGKKGYVVAFEDTEPELMFREATIIANMQELFDAFGEPTRATAFVPPIEVDVDGRVDSRGVQFFGNATLLRPEGEFFIYRCLADVGGLLCVVEARVAFQSKSTTVESSPIGVGK